MFKKYRERYISQGEEELPGSGSEGRAAPALSPRPVAAHITRPNVLGSGRFSGFVWKGWKFTGSGARDG